MARSAPCSFAPSKIGISQVSASHGRVGQIGFSEVSVLEVRFLDIGVLQLRMGERYPDQS
jgi:hypothetical protein